MTEPLMLSVARLCTGLLEAPGVASNPVIVHWAKDLGVPGYTNDDIAWCALFFNRVAMACHYTLTGTGYDLLRAKTAAVWGQPLKLPTIGAVMVFQRDGGHHVGWYVGERVDAYRVFGGNQGNTVNETWIQKDRLRAVRWPSGVALPTTGATWLNTAGSVSANEA